jgi:hypothetical protein
MGLSRLVAAKLYFIGPFKKVSTPTSSSCLYDETPKASRNKFETSKSLTMIYMCSIFSTFQTIILLAGYFISNQNYNKM